MARQTPTAKKVVESLQAAINRFQADASELAKRDEQFDESQQRLISTLTGQLVDVQMGWPEHGARAPISQAMIEQSQQALEHAVQLNHASMMAFGTIVAKLHAGKPDRASIQLGNMVCDGCKSTAINTRRWLGASAIDSLEKATLTKWMLWLRRR